MYFVKSIGARAFELEVYESARDYRFRMIQSNERVDLWGVLPNSELHVTQNKLGAAAIRHIVKSQRREAPRLQGYEIYLLNLWARELEA